MQSLFGIQLPTPVVLAIAFAVIFALLAIFALLLRKLSGSRLNGLGSSGRARQPRLGLVDAFDLDRQRQLVIVRRDHVEHLVMIGGPNDLVIESNIVRGAAPAGRDPAEPRLDAGIPAPGALSPAPAQAPPVMAPVPQPPVPTAPMPHPPLPQAPMGRPEPLMGTPTTAVPPPPAPPQPIRPAPERIADVRSTSRATIPTAPPPRVDRSPTPAEIARRAVPQARAPEAPPVMAPFPVPAPAELPPVPVASPTAGPDKKDDTDAAAKLLAALGVQGLDVAPLTPARPGPMMEPATGASPASSRPPQAPAPEIPRTEAPAAEAPGPNAPSSPSSATHAPAPEAAAQPAAARAAEPAAPQDIPETLQIPAKVAAAAPTPELSDMARRLEEALKRPFDAVQSAAKTPPVMPEPRPAPPVAPAPAPAPPVPPPPIPAAPVASAAPLLRQEARVEVRPPAEAPAEPKPPEPQAAAPVPTPPERPATKAGLDLADFDSLEAEMSRLLGRETNRGKT